jgi:cell division FtsZ-interacting protein ZapD
MPRQKRTSSVLQKTEQQTIGFESIDPRLDFGDSISLKHLNELTGELREELNQYNKMLNTLDSAKEKIEALEKSIRQTSERLTSGVATKYGKDSREYEIIGRVRTSDRVHKAVVTRLKSNADAKASDTETA